MKKIIILILCFSLLFSLSISVYAADSFALVLSYDNTLGCYKSTIRPSVTSGNYNVSLLCNGSSYATTATVLANDSGNANISCYFNDVEGRPYIIDIRITNSNPPVIAYAEYAANSYRLIFSKITNITFEEAVTDGLGSLLDWVGMLINNLLSGPLGSLLIVLAIGISISLLLFAVKLIFSLR